MSLTHEQMNTLEKHSVSADYTNSVHSLKLYEMQENIIYLDITLITDDTDIQICFDITTEITNDDTELENIASELQHMLTVKTIHYDSTDIAYTIYLNAIKQIEEKYTNSNINSLEESKDLLNNVTNCVKEVSIDVILKQIIKNFKDIKKFADIYSAYCTAFYPYYPNALLDEAEDLMKKIRDINTNYGINILKNLYDCEVNGEQSGILVDSDRNYVAFLAAYKELIGEHFWKREGTKLAEYPTKEQWKQIERIENMRYTEKIKELEEKNNEEFKPFSKLTSDDAKNFIKKWS